MNFKHKQILDLYCGWILTIIFTPLVIILDKIFNQNRFLNNPKNIVFIKMVGGGTLIILYPSLYALRKKLADTKFIIITTPSLKPFAETLKIFDQIITIDDKDINSLLFSAIRALFHSFRVDTIIDLEVHSQLSCIFTGLTISKNRIGFYIRNFFLKKKLYTHLIYFSPFSGSFNFYDLLPSLYSAPLTDINELRKYFLEKNQIKIHKKTNSEVGHRKIGIGHACSNFMPERMLSSKQWELYIASRLTQDNNMKLHFFGGKISYSSTEKLIEDLRQKFPDLNIENLCDNSLTDTLIKMAEMDEFWTIDSALNHYARLMGLKIVSFWGPTSPKILLRKIPELSENIYYKNVPCSPCVHINLSSPCKGDNICIKNIFKFEGSESLNELSIIIHSTENKL